ncbi:Adenylate isopentenyltransferase 3, chloroplastic [Morella rubra]|uniref:adenylate dimethylallyltransferase (ADP/ATP-dependent) n=1 Tax=Morella rubra TaxID=262757 RepID=A0A6A1W4Z1_9ROSI|nr:Adenylate isopentenyltransferase 3, chloroplastic [Morella rubra]
MDQMVGQNVQGQRDKVVIIMGATGTGKSKLSIYLATRYRAEIVNSDKMQVYKGLDIVTNKVTWEEQCGVPHHLLGIRDPYTDFTVEDFCYSALHAIESILSRGRLPIIVGGSNRYIEALIDGDESKFRSKYNCCILWVDVSMEKHYPFLSERIDQMVENGLIEELSEMFDPNLDYSRGIFRSIGVPEFDQYFRTKPYLNDENCEMLLQKAISEMKENTWDLAHRQLKKIHRLQYGKGWGMHRLDATEVFGKRGKEAEEAWKDCVGGPGLRIVAHFLKDITKQAPADVIAVDHES